MKEELVSFETAKLAKEAGFPQTVYDYPLCDEFGSIHTVAYFTTSFPDKEWYGLMPQSLLQRWLREEYGIDIYVYRTWAMDNSYNYVVMQNNDESTIQKQVCEPNRTYESALEAGLQEALKLI